MITRADLEAAIAECQGERNPNAQTCIKLAAYYTILEHLEPKEIPSGFSYAPAPVIDTGERFVDYPADTELSKLIDGKEAVKAWTVMDELMQAVRMLMPPLYNGVVDKLKRI